MIKKEIVGKEGKDLNLAKLCFEKSSLLPKSMIF